MNKLLGILGAIAFLLLLVVDTVAQAPANNDFANAITLVGPIVTTTGSNVGANKQGGRPGEPNHGGNRGGASVWWTWTATASGQTTIDTEGSDFNTLLGIYTGTVFNQLTSVAGNDDFNGNSWSRVQFNAIAGTTYRIAVDGFRSGQGGGAPPAATGNITLHVKGIGGITFLTPANGTVFTVGDPIPVGVTIDADFPNPPATRVDFYVGNTLFASKSAAPFSAVATNIPAGSNTVYVIAQDSTGAPIQSSVQSIFVQSIGVTLLTPFEDTLYGNTNPITVTAWSYLPVGSITNIEFFVDGVKFGETTTAPPTAVWSNVVGGAHRFTAVGRSDSGAVYNSQPVNIGVATSLIATGAVWKYLDDGSDQGTAWFAPGFDDNSWASGPGEIGFGDGDESTVVASGPDGNFYVTYYFRRNFVVGDLSSLSNVLVALERDDGAVAYLNGQEVFRSPNMPQAPTNITYLTLTTDTIGIEDTVDNFFLSPTNFVTGNNVFAVEVHQQAPTSSDISFNLTMLGIPVIVHNLSPEVGLTAPVNNAFLLAPGSVPLAATASDADGSVVKVEFFDGGVKIGGDLEAPYTAQWLSPAVGPHELTAVATDDQGATQKSAVVNVMIFDATGTPFARVTAPPDGHVAEGPTNMLVTAFASATDGVTNVEFFANGVSIGSDVSAPYSVIWNAPFGTSLLTAVASGADGRTGVSAASGVTITIPPTNVVAPVIFSQSPLAGVIVTNTLTNIVVTFSERVQGVDASDLLVNGVPASSVRGNGSLSNFTFTFAQPFYGPVAVTWAAGHGITDYGYPTVLPFDGTAPGASWSYTLLDRLAPTVIAKTPAAGSTVTNLSEISVTFSEPVTGVDADDFLINGAVARGVTGGDANYIFSVAQPSAGTVNITWSPTNNIFDLSDGTNAFNRTGAGATWSFTLDTRVTLVQSNSAWNFVKGFAEASDPVEAWRQPGFDDSGWSNAPAPFYFGDPYTNAAVRGTLLSDMQSNYTTIFLRREFEVVSRGTITNLLLNHQSDDGFIAWLNGVEVLRYNVPGGALPYNAVASTAANEPSQTGAAYIVATLTNAAVSRLVNGVNVLAIQAFNQNLTNSSDFGFNAQLYYFPIDATVVPPRVVSSDPLAGDVFQLTNVTINFSEGVSGVDAADLLVNGIPAAGLSTTTNATYTFDFPQPPYGPVLITWATNHGIADFDNPPKAFDGNAASARISYTILNPSSPRIAIQSPAAGTTLTGLTSVVVTFTEPVAGVEASDLLVSGVAAGSVSSADNTTFNFAFAQPPFGTVTIRWATNHGITDLELPPAPFDPTRFGGQWGYTLINPVPSAVVTAPTNNTFLLPPATVQVRATAADNDGTIARVELFQGGTKLAETTNSPVSITVSNLPVGAYVFSARATDNQGLIGTSAPVVLNVVTSLPITLVRGPYLQIGTPTGGIVRWRTDAVSDGLVYYGTDLNHLTNAAVQTSVTNEHIVRITGLQPDTQYYYSIGSAGFRLVGGDNDGTNYWFKTSPVPGTSTRPVRIWALGDAGTAGNGDPARQRSTRDAFYNYAATNGPADLMMMLGDNAYNSGTDSEHQAAVFDMYPATLRNKFLWPTLGNHETSQSTTATDFPYLNIFSLPQNGEAGGLASGTEKYYSFDYANVHFVCLDSMTSGSAGTTPMARWLVNDLEANAQDWVVVFFHHSLYTKGTHDSDTEGDLVALRQNIIPILEAHGVDLVLMGHSHVYERSYLLDGHYGLSSTFTSSMKVDGGDGREEGTGAYRKNEAGRGVVYTIAGSAGQALGGPLNHPAHFFSLNELGTVVIDVSSNRLDAQFLNSTGDIRDHYTLIKQALATPPASFVARALDANNVSLAWTDSATNELGYILERSTDGLNFTAIATNAVDSTGALDSGLLAATTYFYRLRAFNLGGDSLSSIAGVTTLPDTAAPAAPNGLVAVAGNGDDAYRSQIVLRWRDRSANEAGFLIERSADGVNFSPIGTVGANTTLYMDRRLASATTYYYRVRSFNTAGDSAPSNLDGDQTHPRDSLVTAGESATFHAGVEGAAPVRYQWRFLNVAIPGATNETLVLPSTQPGDEGSYTVTVTDAIRTITSNPAWLFVFAPPLIVEHPASRTNVLGTTATLRVTASGTSPFYYQWRKNGANLPGTTGPQLTLGPITFADQADYTVVVLNSLGSVTSLLARITVNTAPVAAPDRLFTFHDEALTIPVSLLLTNDTDADADTLFLAAVDAASSNGGGSAVLNNGSITYTPPAGYLGDDTFGYALLDSRGAQSRGLVTVTIHDNSRPVLAPLANRTASVLRTLVVSNSATDQNPANHLTFTLAPGAPTNAIINPTNGLFRWAPSRAQAPGHYLIAIRATDDGFPPLTGTTTLDVTVKDYAELTLGTAMLNAGDSNSIPITLFTSAPLTNAEWQVTLDTTRLHTFTIEPLLPAVADVSITGSGDHHLSLNIAALPGQALQGTQQLARLHFQTQPGQTSAFLPLDAHGFDCDPMTPGLDPTLLINDGRVVVINGRALLEGTVNAAGQRTLTLYGKPGVSYILESSTSQTPGSTWRNRGTFPMTNFSRALSIGTQTGGTIYYRARQ